MSLIEAIQEISMQETDLRFVVHFLFDLQIPLLPARWLSVEYAEIIRDQEMIRKEHSQRAKTLERLTGILTDLFVDWHKLHGVDARSGIPTLQTFILNGAYQEFYQMILQFS